MTSLQFYSRNVVMGTIKKWKMHGLRILMSKCIYIYIHIYYKYKYDSLVVAMATGSEAAAPQALTAAAGEGERGFS